MIPSKNQNDDPSYKYCGAVAPGGTACGVSDGRVSDVWVNDGQSCDGEFVPDRLGGALRERARNELG